MQGSYYTTYRECPVPRMSIYIGKQKRDTKQLTENNVHSYTPDRVNTHKLSTTGTTLLKDVPVQIGSTILTSRHKFTLI